jgi:hypothetical protein
MSSALFGQRHIDMMFAIWSKYSMEPCQVHSRFRHQRHQLADEIKRFKDDVRGLIAVRRFELISNITW